MSLENKPKRTLLFSLVSWRGSAVTALRPFFGSWIAAGDFALEGREENPPPPLLPPHWCSLTPLLRIWNLPLPLGHFYLEAWVVQSDYFLLFAAQVLTTVQKCAWEALYLFHHQAIWNLFHFLDTCLRCSAKGITYPLNPSTTLRLVYIPYFVRQGVRFGNVHLLKFQFQKAKFKLRSIKQS